MTKCVKCGQVNDTSSNFCRFCGFNFAGAPSTYPPQQPRPFPQPQAPNFENSPPRPYAWKTDEFRTDPKGMTSPVAQFRGAGTTQPDLNLQPYQQASPMAAPGYHCPRCHSQLLPRRERRISTPGWIVFAVLLIAFFPLFWVGFLIREDVSVCPVCNHRFTS